MVKEGQEITPTPRAEKAKEGAVIIIQGKAVAVEEGHLAGAVALNRRKLPLTISDLERTEKEKKPYPLSSAL